MADPRKKFSNLADGGDLQIGDVVVGLEDGINTRWIFEGFDGIYLPLAGGTMSGSIIMSQFEVSNVLYPSTANDLANKMYADLAIANALNVYLLLTGGTMSGDISMDNTYIVTDTPDPVNNTDIATKNYVDTYFGRSGDQNPILGGNFDTNPWQDGTSFVGVSNNLYLADQFFMIKVNAGVLDCARVADADPDNLFQNCMSFGVTTGSGALAAGDIAAFETLIEGYNWAHFAQNDFTFSFWVKSDEVGTYSIAFQNDGVDRTYVATYTIDMADTWEYKEFFITASPSLGTWDYTNGVGLRVIWTLGAGTDYQTSSLETWNSDDLICSDTQINWCATLNNDFSIALIDMHAGHFTRQVPVRIDQQEWNALYRYYYKTYLPAVVGATTYMQGFNRTANITRAIYPLPVPQRDITTLSTSTATLFRTETGATVAAVSSIALTAGNANSNRDINFDVVTSGAMTAGFRGVVSSANVASYLIFNARF